MKCWHCDSELIWGCDYDFDAYGYIGDGIISTFSCSNCDAEVIVSLKNKEEQNDTSE